MCALAFAALATATLGASSPKFFQAATQTDFLKGDVENLSIDARGQLVLGPAIDLVYETAAPFVWTIATAPDGTQFLGTGNEGKVYRVDPDGKGSVFFDSAELEVHALAPAPNGGLYVGTSPDGKIYKVDRNGTATTFFDPEDKYIWALAVDARGNVYAGTGDKGVIYKIAPDGKGAPFYRTKATHATALAFDKAGNLLVGTESPGKVIRVESTAKASFCSTRRSRKSGRCARRQRHALRRRDERPGQAARGPPRRAPGNDQPAATRRAGSDRDGLYGNHVDRHRRLLRDSGSHRHRAATIGAP